MKDTEPAGAAFVTNGRLKRTVIVSAVLALFLALGLLGIHLFSGQGATSADSSSEATHTASPTHNASPTAPVASAATKSQVPPAAAPTALSVPSADIEVPVLPLTPTEDDLATQSIVPPETLDGYWLTNYGKPGDGSDNTVYITGHSWEGRESPFNRLSTEVEVGDTVTLTTDEGAIDYVVDSVTTHNKDTLKDSDIWNIVPNRLVLISCFTEDLWGKNVIVTAAPVL